MKIEERTPVIQQDQKIAVRRVLTVVENKIELFRKEAAAHWKRITAYAVILLGLSYWMQIQFGSSILWLLGAFNLGFWIYFVHSFWTRPTSDNAKAAFASSISVITFLISMVLPTIETTVQSLNTSVSGVLSKDSVMTISLSASPAKVGTNQRKEAKPNKFGDHTVAVVADGRSTSVDASPEANELKYEKIELGNGSFITRPAAKNYKEKATAKASEPGEIETSRAWDYIQRFLPVAKVERTKYKIPISIQLAQGLIESNAANSKLSRIANNHFGIKTWSKKVPHVVFKDDSPNDMFKVYSGAWESWRDHSKFLQKDNYKSLYSLSIMDYKGWAQGLKRCQYATDKAYDIKLIKVIEQYKLYKFDES